MLVRLSNALDVEFKRFVLKANILFKRMMARLIEGMLALDGTIMLNSD